MNKNGSSLALLYQIFYINTHELRFIVELYLRSQCEIHVLKNINYLTQLLLYHCSFYVLVTIIKTISNNQ